MLWRNVRNSADVSESVLQAMAAAHLGGVAKRVKLATEPPSVAVKETSTTWAAEMTAAGV